MKNETYLAAIGKASHTTFGGKIYKGDFYAHHTLSDITSRILSDWKFDQQCLANEKHRKTGGCNK